jgi:D-beta-D-heptose 7-phosphate kinase / D-beta-D-heptose 1-phosphate adenosyltransferase
VLITVIGDVMLDRTIGGAATRLSPEAPVPVLLQQQVNSMPGGAALVAANLANIGHPCKLMGVIGDDVDGACLHQQLTKLGVHCDLIKDHQTTVKTRFVNQLGQQMMRWDQETCYNGLDVTHKVSSMNVKDQLIIVSDYHKGVVTPLLVNKLVTGGAKVCADPKQAPHVYEGAWLVKPNLAEYESWAGTFDVATAAQLMQHHNWTWLVVTMGADGIMVVNQQAQSWHISQPAREVADVTGAGDCVISVMAQGVANGMSVLDAAERACKAASRNVSRRGTSLVQPGDVENGVVFTNGCFDVLHAGHLHLLREAAQLGDRLVVAINSDASVAQLKGPNRPINDQQTRQAQLGMLPWVDEVLVFDEPTPIELIKQLRPSIIVKGGDYEPAQVVGHELAKVVIVPTLANFSTTGMVRRVTQSIS